MIHYRKAEMKDCREIAVLKGIVWNTTYKGIYSEESLDNYDIPKNQKIFEQIVANPEIEVYVAAHDDRIVGFMTFGRPYKPIEGFAQEIGMLYIFKEYQRQGIGSRFFEIARKHAKENGYDKFCVSVNRKNYNAQEFYRKKGGKIVSESETQLRFGYSI